MVSLNLCRMRTRRPNVFVKCILSRFDESSMGTGIRLLFGGHTVRFAIGN